MLYTSVIKRPIYALPVMVGKTQNLEHVDIAY